MSTKMTEEDWEHTIMVFRACLPRRGRKGVDDRLFLEALHFFTVENVRWRALPERFGHWNSVWKRFNRLSHSGVFEAMFDTLAAMSSSALHFFTVENVHWRALPERYGHWNSVWKRFNRLSKSGVFEAMFDTLAAMSSSAHLVQMFDSTIVRAHVSAAGAKGGSKVRRLVDPKADLAPKSMQNQTNREP